MAYRVSVNGQVARREDGSENMTQEDVYEMDVTPRQDIQIRSMMDELDRIGHRAEIREGITVERIK